MTDELILDDYLAVGGSAVKALGEGKIGGHLVLFGDTKSADLAGDFFTPATDFGLDLESGATVTLRYHHGFDKTVGKRKIGAGKIGKDDVGIWIEAQLNLRDEYEKAIYQMASKGALGWSSSAAPHLVERKSAGETAAEITAWPLVTEDATVTPTPADPRQVVELKSLQATRLELEAQPEEPATGSAEAVKADISVSEPKQEEQIMSDVQTPPADSVEAQLKGMGGRIDAILEIIQNAPAIKSSGYFSQDGGKADAEVKSFGDFLMAIARRDDARLTSVYKSVKAMSTDAGASGGYLVPVEYRTELLRVAFEQSPLLQRVRRVPVSAKSGKYPVLDQYFTPTAGAGESTAAARVKTAKRAEGGAFAETEAKVEMIEWNINDAASGYVKASKELVKYSGGTIERLLLDLIGIAVNAKLEYFVLRGNGVGEPLGILNSGALVNISPDTDATFAYADAVEMVSRFKRISNQAMWLIHPSILTDIGNFQIGTNSGAVFVTNQSASMEGMPLLGYPMFTSEHLPQADASGCVILIDPQAYLLFEDSGLYIDYSEHADFLNGNGVWRFGYPTDGQSWMKSAVTLSGPGSAFTQSPFINFND